MDPHLREARLFDAQTTEADGANRLPRTPIELSETPTRSLKAAPELGQHSREILGEAGYCEPDVESLIAQTTGVRPPPA